MAKRHLGLRATSYLVKWKTRETVRLDYVVRVRMHVNVSYFQIQFM